MPTPLATTLLVAALVGAVIATPATVIVAGLFAWFAVCIELARFWVSGAEPMSERPGLVRSGETEPRATVVKGDAA